MEKVQKDMSRFYKMARDGVTGLLHTLDATSEEWGNDDEVINLIKMEKDLGDAINRYFRGIKAFNEAKAAKKAESEGAK